MRLDESVALVAHGTEGIGRAVALAFAAAGARVMVAGRQERAGAETVEAIESAGGEAAFCRFEPAEEESVQTMIGDAILRFGAVHAVVMPTAPALRTDALSLNANQWDDNVARHLRAPWLVAKYAVPFLKQSGGGSIIFVSGTDAGATLPRRFLHATLDGAVQGMARSLAIEFGPHNVRVNVVSAGFIEGSAEATDVRESADPERSFRRVVATHPLGRVGTPADVARAALWLASPDSGFVTGIAMNVDGGRSAVVQELYDW